MERQAPKMQLTVLKQKMNRMMLGPFDLQMYNDQDIQPIEVQIPPYARGIPPIRLVNY
jgi:hypothetical protein